MKTPRFLHRAAVLAAAATASVTLVQGSANAQDEGVIVTAPYVQRHVTGRSPTGAPIETMSFSIPVSYSDLDLRNPYHMDEFQRRIHYAARTACHELDRAFPLANYNESDAVCVKSAVRDANAQANLVTASYRRW